MAEPQAGWYPDPDGDASKLRYWDGTAWTGNYTDANAATDSSSSSSNTGAAYAPPAQQAIAQGAGQAPTYEMTESDRTLRLVAFVFCIISLVASCWAIIPLAWMIPMSVYCWGIYKGTKANTTVFGVCTLIFCSLVGGILLLCSTKQE